MAAGMWGVPLEVFIHTVYVRGRISASCSRFCFLYTSIWVSQTSHSRLCKYLWTVTITMQ